MMKSRGDWIDTSDFFVALNPTTCHDQLPEDWQPDNIFSEGVRCGLLDCNSFTDADSCSMEFSVKPLSNCVTSTRGKLGDFCKLSCKNCGKISIVVFILI